MDPKSRSFLGAAAAAIKAFCLLFINAVGVADDGVAMAAKAVKTARERQYLELDIASGDYETELRDQAALRRVKQEQEIRAFIGADPEREALMKAARENIDLIIKKSKAELHANKQE